MSQRPDIHTLETLLHDPELAAALSPDVQADLLLKGVILTLQQDGSETALNLLAQAASGDFSADIHDLAVKGLSELAINGFQQAIDALYRLATGSSQVAIRQLIASHHLQPSRPSLQALLQWLVMQDTGSPRAVNLAHLTQAFFEDATHELQERIAAQAKSTTYKKWAQLVTAVSQDTPEGYEQILDLYPSLSDQEQEICLSLLDKAALSGNPCAQETICKLFTQYDDLAARDIALKQGYLPGEPYQQALFYFLVGDMEHYQQVDFEHNLLVTAYEVSNRQVRRRLLAFSRQTGYIEWLRAVSPAADIRWLSDLSDADWDLAIQRLIQTQRFNELWRLAQMAPPIWGAAILINLDRVSWQPASAFEKEGFKGLLALAHECYPSPVEIKPFMVLHSISDDLTCLALNSTSTLLAAGSSGQPIFLWELPAGNLRFPALIGPASTTRAAAFSPDGVHLVAANGDQRIRIFRHQNGQIIKTLEGHHGLIRALMVHPNGRVLVSAGFDGTIRFWRFPLGIEIKKIDTDVRETFSLAYLKEMEAVASAGAGANISIWKLPEGDLLRRLPGEKDGTIHLASSPSSDLLASAGRNKQITLWNTTNGNVVRKFSEQPAQITGLAFHPNDHMIFTSGADGAICAWNVSTGTSVARFKAHSASISSIVLSDDGKMLVSSDEKGTLFLWDLATFTWLRTSYQPGKHLPSDQIAEKLHDPALPAANKKWLAFTSALWKWAQRFDIEISEPLTIQLGEFDIEL